MTKAKTWWKSIPKNIQVFLMFCVVFSTLFTAFSWLTTRASATDVQLLRDSKADRVAVVELEHSVATLLRQGAADSVWKNSLTDKLNSIDQTNREMNSYIRQMYFGGLHNEQSSRTVLGAKK